VEKTLENSTGDGLICDKVIVGKPNKMIIDIILKDHNIDKSELSKFIIIGDNPSTDICLANNIGVDSCLVFSGVIHNYDEAKEWIKKNSNYQSTHIM